MKELKIENISIVKLDNMIQALKQCGQFDSSDSVIEAYVKWRNLANK